MSDDGKITINRTLVGVLALCCLLAAAAIWVGAPDDNQWNLWRGGFTRVGLLMSAFWLALPTRDREAAWARVSSGTFIGILLAVIAVIRLPLKVVIPAAVVLLIVGSILRPKAKKRPGH